MAFDTPATPQNDIVRNQETYSSISYDLHKRYRIGVGSLLHLVKHSQSELSKMVRELSKFLDKENMIHYKALLRLIKYVIDTKYYRY